MIKTTVFTLILAVALTAGGVCQPRDSCRHTLIKINDTSGSMDTTQYKQAVAVQSDVLAEQVAVLGIGTVEVMLVNDAFSMYTPDTHIFPLTCATVEAADENLAPTVKVKFGVQYIKKRDEELNRLHGLRRQEVTEAGNFIREIRQIRTAKTSIYGMLSFIADIWDPECYYEALTDLENDYPFDSVLIAKLQSHTWEHLVIMVIPSQLDMKKGGNIEERVHRRIATIKRMMPGVHVVSPAVFRRKWKDFFNADEAAGDHLISSQAVSNASSF